MHKLNFTIAILLAIIAFVLFSSSLNNEFVYDDTMQIVNDDYIHDTKNINDVISLNVLRKDVVDRTRPFNILTLMIDALVWNQNPFGYHLTNIVLHSLCALLLFLFISKLLNGNRKHLDRKIIISSFAGTILFIIHPLNVETVSIITNREDLLVQLFTLSNLLIWPFLLNPNGRRKLLLYLLMFVLQIFCILSKESGIVAPLTLIVYWFFVLRKEYPNKTNLVLPLLLLLFTLGIMLITSLLEPHTSALVSVKPNYPGGTFSTMLSLQPRVLVFQFYHILFPHGLNLVYGPFSLQNFELIPSVIALIIIFSSAIFLSRKNNLMAFALVLFALGLLPTSNLIPQFIVVADHFLYLPMIGLCLLVTVITSAILSYKSIIRPIYILFLTVLFGVLAFVNYNRQQTFRDGVTMWMDVLKKNPYSSAAAASIGGHLFINGDYEGALKYYRMALQIKQVNDPTYIAGISLCLQNLGDVNGAISSYRTAIGLDTSFKLVDNLRKTKRWNEKELEAAEAIVTKLGRE